MPDVPINLHDAVPAALTRPGVVRIHFQPIVDLVRGVVTGYEALSRFNGPPAATPDKWFAAAHDLGLGERLEATALSAALDVRPRLPRNSFLTVNVGPAALLSEPVQHVFGRAGDLRGVVIEVTEQQPIDDYDAVNGVLAPLRAAGAMLAVDDAGAGFSSLKHITTLRPDLVKADRGLVAGIDEDPTKAAVIETLGIFASRLDAWLLAEGVETARELERLISLGVPLAQGYFLARPAPAMGPMTDEAAALCARRDRLADRGELAALAEVAPRVQVSAGDAAIADAFLRHPGGRWVVRVDEFDRPIELAGRPDRPGAATRRRYPALCVADAERLTDVVRRVLVRAEHERFIPVALCDDLGRLTGLIPVERLLERLAVVADGGGTPSDAAPAADRRSA